MRDLFQFIPVFIILFFDLGGAVFSALAVAGSFDPRMFMMLIWILPGVLSYIFWQQLKKAK